MKVLVCGGRDFDDHDLLNRTLGRLDSESRIGVIIHGCAPGADSIADKWASFAGRGVERYPANWRIHGRAAGPIRNTQMLAEGRPDVVVAFPGGRGTANMVMLAKAAGVRVIEVPAPPRQGGGDT